MALPRSDAFFAYLKEREAIRLRKEADLPYPWTEDEILRTYKFTNVRREFDRTSMKLREMFYNDHADAPRKDILMNCALFRYFGTWEFAEAVGWQTHEDFDFEMIRDTAADRLAFRERVFTGAYVITNGGISAPKQDVVLDYYLSGLHTHIEEVLDVVQKTNSWEHTARAMRKLQGFGGSGFMTKETLLDTTYTNFWEGGLPCDWWNWTPIGPGARRGAARVMGDDNGNDNPLNEERSMYVIMDLVCDEVDIGGRLSPTDIQFGLCEFDKYERVRLGQGKPRSKYKP